MSAETLPRDPVLRHGLDVYVKASQILRQPKFIQLSPNDLFYRNQHEGLHLVPVVYGELF